MKFLIALALVSLALAAPLQQQETDALQTREPGLTLVDNQGRPIKPNKRDPGLTVVDKNGKPVKANKRDPGLTVVDKNGKPVKAN